MKSKDPSDLNPHGLGNPGRKVKVVPGEVGPCRRCDRGTGNEQFMRLYAVASIHKETSTGQFTLACQSPNELFTCADQRLNTKLQSFGHGY